MWKKLVILLTLLALLAGAVTYYGYDAVWADNINDEHMLTELKIPTGSSFEDVVQQLKSHDVLKSVASFRQVAKLMNYDKDVVPSGRYIIQKDWSNRALIGALRTRSQSPVKVTFNNHRTVAETVGTITSYLEVDSATVLSTLLADTTLEELRKTKETAITLFVPNTYYINWDISATDLIQRMAAEAEKFWNKKDRLDKLDSAGLTREEVFTLASIVEKESQASHERPIIAGLYLNRLERGIPLQADPTVVFAVGDFSIRRVLNKHLAYDSPYNTYKYVGLPPGPIYLPSIESIDAVLAPTDHEYLFMCAKPGYNSEHAFAKTAEQHSRNANKYRSWLNSEGIRR